MNTNMFNTIPEYGIVKPIKHTRMVKENKKVYIAKGKGW